MKYLKLYEGFFSKRKKFDVDDVDDVDYRISQDNLESIESLMEDLEDSLNLEFNYEVIPRGAFEVEIRIHTSDPLKDHSFTPYDRRGGIESCKKLMNSAEYILFISNLKNKYEIFTQDAQVEDFLRKRGEIKFYLRLK